MQQKTLLTNFKLLKKHFQSISEIFLYNEKTLSIQFSYMGIAR